MKKMAFVWLDWNYQGHFFFLRNFSWIHSQPRSWKKFLQAKFFHEKIKSLNCFPYSSFNFIVVDNKHLFWFFWLEQKIEKRKMIPVSNCQRKYKFQIEKFESEVFSIFWRNFLTDDKKWRSSSMTDWMTKFIDPWDIIKTIINLHNNFSIQNITKWVHPFVKLFGF